MDSRPPYAVHVRNVSKSFSEGDSVVRALRDVNFDAKLGELLMIVGPSGCGKTTLLSVIAGTLRFDSGFVDVMNYSLHQMTDSAITDFRKVNVGFIFQQYHLIHSLNCLENVSIPMILNGYEKQIAETAASEILEKVGLKEKKREFPKNLSGGQQQRVAIARALVHRPGLVICDEPTAALDAATGEKVLELLVDVAKDPDRCVVVVTHDSRIFKFADRIVKMDDGRMTGVISNNNRI